MWRITAFIATPVVVLAAVSLLYVIYDSSTLPSREVSLRSALEGADRLVIQDLGWHVDSPLPDHEIHGTGEIEAMLNLIDINEEESGVTCKCLGQYKFQFYRRDEIVAAVSYHHWESLRWRGGEWDGDGQLTVKSQERLLNWLKDHGYFAPKDERDELIRGGAAAKSDLP